MSLQTKHTRSNRSILSVCAVAMAAAVMAAAPTWTNAHEPATTDTASTPSAQMDSQTGGDQKMGGDAKMGGMKSTDGMSMTGDVDYDFAANMRMHHQAALDMAQGEVKNGKNAQMVQMAKDIIAAQTKEIAVLDRWLEAHGKP